MKDYRKKNPEYSEYMKIYLKDYRTTHTEKCKEAIKKWREANREYMREYMRAYMRCYKTRELGTFKLEDIKRLTREQRNLCFYCGNPVGNEREAHIEHVIPLSNGGSNELSNIVIACGTCNRSKYTKDGFTFLSYLVERGDITPEAASERLNLLVERQTKLFS
jgi:5-methylcytosine-specific restriction endonuclease McrA